MWDRCAGGSSGVGFLQKALDLHDRANPDFFDTLVALKFLDRDGDGPEGRYRMTGRCLMIFGNVQGKHVQT